MRNFLICLLTIVCITVATATAQNVTSKIPIEKGERWWGGMTGLGDKMPFVKPTAKYDFKRDNLNNQTFPFFISNKGRYIYSEEPFVWEFDGQNFVIESVGKIEAIKAGKNLREAFVIASNSHFKPSGVVPPAIFFERAQWNTWIELIYDQNQAGIEAYASNIIANGFKPGVLMIDDNWQRDYGNFSFKAETFPDPKGMIDRLHKAGFKVMVWVSPFVSPDSPEYRYCSEKGYLVTQADGKTPAIVRWWNGASAVYNLTCPAAAAYLEGELRDAQAKYGIDGFKFDGGDVQFYETTTANAQTKAWQDLALRFPINELRASWGGGANGSVQRLGDKDYSWNALKLLIPEMVAGSMLGYPYMCPDLIGGGQYGSFRGVDRTKIDQTLIVRWAQASALMPMMQFSIAPWQILDQNNLKLVKQAAELHEKFAPYIMELANQAAKTGEPIVRPMEYIFPAQGFSDCKDQFMLGSKYMVAPVLNKDNSRTVRLPKGRWRDDMGKNYRGPVVIEINAPLSRLPYFELR